MKKLLIATAAMAVVAGAQAQSSVTIYGSIDAGYSSVESKATTISSGVSTKTTNSGIAQSSDVSSRWGFKGTEDLGGGLKANFNVETSIGAGSNGALNSNTDATGAWTHSTNVGNRAMWAGISTAGGLEVRGGLQNQFIRDVATGYNSNGTTNVVGDLLAGNSSVFANRHNAISATQTLGAVKLGVAMTGKTTEVSNKADVDSGKGYELMANYAAGNFALGAAYRKVDTSVAAVAAADKAKAGLTLLGLPSTSTKLVAADFADSAATDTETKTTIVGTSYNFGPVKAFASYGKQETKDALNTATDTERTVTSVGVNGNVTAATQLFVTYSTGETKGATTAVKRDIDGYVLGARYSLSKRTTAYAIYGESDVDSGNDAVATTNTKAKQYAVGINHAF